MTYLLQQCLLLMILYMTHSFCFFSSRDYSALNLISRRHISQSPWVISFYNPTFNHIPPPFICLGASALCNNITCCCGAHRALSPNPNSFDIMWLSYLTVKRNFSDKQPATWQQHEMRYRVFFKQWHSELIGVSNHVWKGHREACTHFPDDMSEWHASQISL